MFVYAFKVTLPYYRLIALGHTRTRVNEVPERGRDSVRSGPLNPKHPRLLVAASDSHRSRHPQGSSV